MIPALLLAATNVIHFDASIPVDFIGHSSNIVIPGKDPTLGHLQSITITADIEGHSTSTPDNQTPSPCHVWLGEVPGIPQLQTNKAGLHVETHLGFELFTRVLDLPNVESDVAALSSVTLHQDAAGALPNTLTFEGDEQTAWLRPGVLTLNIDRPGLFTETDSCGFIQERDQTKSGGMLHVTYTYR